MSRPAVHVVARFTAAPGKAEDLQALLRGAVAPTRAEAGCVKYELLVNPSDAGDLVFIEEWESDAHLDAHNLTPHIEGARAVIGPLLGAPPDIRRYRIVL